MKRQDLRHDDLVAVTADEDTELGAITGKGRKRHIDRECRHIYNKPVYALPIESLEDRRPPCKDCEA